METLFIKLDPHSDLAQWAIIDAAGNPDTAIRQGDLSQVREFSRQRRIVCLLPGNQVYLNGVVLPVNRNKRKYLQAAPYALEDELAEDLEELHFALGKEQLLTPTTEEDAGKTAKKVKIPVAVVNKNWLQTWLQRLADAGLKPHTVIPEVLSVPWEDNSWSVVRDHDMALVRTGPGQGFVCDNDNLEPLLNSALAAADTTPQQIRMWNYNGPLAAPVLNSDIRIEPISTDRPWLGTLAQGYRREQAINLLQGDFSYREEYGKLLKPWKIPAILFGSFIALLFISNIIEYNKLSSESESLQAEMVAIYQTAFPDARNIPDPRKQLADKIKELSGATVDSDFLYLLNLGSTAITGTAGAKITSLTFGGRNLDLELSVPNVQMLDELKQKLDQIPDIQTEIQSASAEGQEVNGRLRISKR
jgi:general secretion pathway protein L